MQPQTPARCNPPHRMANICHTQTAAVKGGTAEGLPSFPHWTSRKQSFPAPRMTPSSDVWTRANVVEQKMSSVWACHQIEALLSSINDTTRRVLQPKMQKYLQCVHWRTRHRGQASGCASIYIRKGFFICDSTFFAIATARGCAINQTISRQSRQGQLLGPKGSALRSKSAHPPWAWVGNNPRTPLFAPYPIVGKKETSIEDQAQYILR
jgi:hypothetical protein